MVQDNPDSNAKPYMLRSAATQNLNKTLRLQQKKHALEHCKTQRQSQHQSKRATAASPTQESKACAMLPLPQRNPR